MCNMFRKEKDKRQNYHYLHMWLYQRLKTERGGADV